MSAPQGYVRTKRRNASRQSGINALLSIMNWYKLIGCLSSMGVNIESNPEICHGCVLPPREFKEPQH